MTIDDLYTLVNRLLPPVAVAVLAILAVVSSMAHAWLKRRPRAIALAVGCANIAAVYLWTHLAGLSVESRAMGIRIAIVTLLLSILFYNQSAQPRLFALLRRARAWARGRMWWKK